MKFVRRTRDGAELLWTLLLCVGLPALALVVGAGLRMGLPRPLCTLKQWTGLPCPTCGATRLLQSLSQGDVVEAAMWNPLVFGGMTIVVLWAGASTLRHLIGLPSWRPVLGRRERVAACLTLFVLVVANWIYLFSRGV